VAVDDRYIVKTSEAVNGIQRLLALGPAGFNTKKVAELLGYSERPRKPAASGD
jgi:hypothetical protein